MYPSKRQNKYLVIGNSVQHSLSPKLHLEFAKQFALQLEYDYYNVTQQTCPQLLHSFAKQAVHGVNITAPLKEQFIPYLTNAADNVRASGAVNTLTLRDGLVYGANTDGIGFITDIVERHQVPLIGARILILGAGGAVRGINAALLAAAPRSITIANRDLNKARRILACYADSKIALAATTYENLTAKEFDVIINATSCGHLNILPPLPADLRLENTICYDLNYGGASRKLHEYLQQQKVPKIYNGFGMLLEQAAASFYIWHNKRPDTAQIYAKFTQNA